MPIYVLYFSQFFLLARKEMMTLSPLSDIETVLCFRYLTVNSDDEKSAGKPEKSSTYFFWHTKLADFFRYHCDVAKVVEEYPYHLACLDDKFHLAQCLCDWKVFDRLYHEEYSSQLMAYWRKVGICTYTLSCLSALSRKYIAFSNVCCLVTWITNEFVIDVCCLAA